MKLIVTVPELRYAGKTYAQGADLEVTEKEAKALKMLRKADDAPPPRAPAAHAATTRAPAAEPAPEPAAEPVIETTDLVAQDEAEGDTPHPRQAYKTRRLKARD